MKITLEHDGNRFEQEAEFAVGFLSNDESLTSFIVGDASQSEVMAALAQTCIDVAERVFDDEREAKFMLLTLGKAIVEHVKEEM